MSLTIYRIDFRNKQLDEVRVDITDYSQYDPIGDNPQTIISLIGVAPAFELETFNVNEDKFSTVIGQRATIRFKSTNAVNFSTFSEGEDYRYFVRATYSNGTKFIFSGWLVMDDNQQLYLPPGQTVTLTATDNLAALKDIELSDFNGARPEGKYRLIEIIAWCLRKTEGPFPGWGASIYDNIKVAFNLFENNHDNTDNCPLNQTYVDIRTFEKNSTELEDCFTVLDKIIFSLGCRVCQYNNNWWIIRTDEYKNSYFYVQTYSIGGVYQSSATSVYLDKLVGDDDGSPNDIKIINADTVQRLQRAYKKVTLNARYNFPDEIPENAGFLRGTLSSSVSSPPYDLYVPDNWDYVKMVGGGGEGAHTNEYFIKVTFDTFGREIERFLHLNVTSGNVDMRVKSTSPVYVCNGDKFKFDLDFRYSTDLGGGSGHFTLSQAQIRLYGDDSTYWTLYGASGSNIADESVYWEQTDYTFIPNAHYLNYEGSSENVDFTEWQSISVEAPAIPVTGYIIIYLMNNQTSGSQTKDFYNLNFEYIPLINGTNNRQIRRPIRPVRLPRPSADSDGESFSMSTADLYSKKFDEDSLLFDAPCKMFKGAMFYYSGGNYYLTSQWFDRVVLALVPDEGLNIGEMFLKWQTYYVWNQLRLSTRILNGSFFGIDTASGDYVSIINRFAFHYNNALYPVNNMYFIILSMRQDWHSCQWTGTLAQVHRISDSREQGIFEFKYIS